MQNKNEWPWWLTKAIESSVGEYHPGEGDYTATSLIKPPMIYALEKKYHPEPDVADVYDAFDGNCKHNELERLLKGDPNLIIEERFYRWIRVESAPGKKDFLISGQIDLYDLTQDWLADHKTSKIYKYLYGDLNDYETQLNVNAWIMRGNGYNPQHLGITAFPRDWNRSEAKNKPEYPDNPFFVQDIPFWHDEDVETFICKAIVEKENALKGHARLCTPEERWRRPDTYAVKKNNNKRAVRLFENQEEAESYAAADDLLWVEYRPGVDVRCEQWCPVAQWCSYYQENYYV